MFERLSFWTITEIIRKKHITHPTGPGAWCSNYLHSIICQTGSFTLPMGTWWPFRHLIFSFIVWSPPVSKPQVLYLYMSDPFQTGVMTAVLPMRLSNFILTVIRRLTRYWRGPQGPFSIYWLRSRENALSQWENTHLSTVISHRLG